MATLENLYQLVINSPFLPEGICPDGKWIYTPERQMHFIRTARAEAVKWATDVIKDPNTLYLDTETTGVDLNYDEIVELTIMNYTGKKILFNDRFKPRKRIPKEASEINHIWQADVEDCQPISERWSELSEILSGKRIIAYNSVFDHGMMKNTAIIHKLRPTEGYVKPVWDCAMYAYSAYMVSFKWWKLTEAEATLKEEGMLPHSAVDDTFAVYNLCKHLSQSNPKAYDYMATAPDVDPDPAKIDEINSAIISGDPITFEYRSNPDDPKKFFKRQVIPLALFKSYEKSFYMVAREVPQPDAKREIQIIDKTYKLEKLTIVHPEDKVVAPAEVEVPF